MPDPNKNSGRPASVSNLPSKLKHETLAQRLESLQIKPPKTKTRTLYSKLMTYGIIPFLLGLLVIGFWIYERKKSGISPLPSVGISPQSTSPSPAEIRIETKKVASIGLGIDVPSNWQIKEDGQASDDAEISVEITNREFILRITKNPVYTGGGFGFIFDGSVADGDLESHMRRENIKIKDEEFLKKTVLIGKKYLDLLDPRLLEENDSLEEAEIFGGSVYFNQRQNQGVIIDEPGIVLKDKDGRAFRYSIVYETAVKFLDDGSSVAQLLNWDDEDCQKAVAVMDEMVKSIRSSSEVVEAESHWLQESTSEEEDPEAGAMFIDVFLKGEEEKPCNLYSSQYHNKKVDRLPNLIYALIERVDLSKTERITAESAMSKALEADWRLQVSWNSPKAVTCIDGTRFKPKVAVFWNELEKPRLYLLDPNADQENQYFWIIYPDDEAYTRQINEIVEKSIRI